MKKHRTDKSFRKFLHYYKEVPFLLFFDLFFSIVMTAVSVGIPFLIQYVTEFAENKQFTYIIYAFSIAFGILIIRMFAQFYVSYVGNMLGNKMEIIMRKNAVDKLHRLETKYFDNVNSGAIVSRVVNDLRDITNFAHHIPEDALTGFATAVGGLTFAFLKSWIIGLVLLIIFLITLIFWIFRARSIRASRKKVRVENAAMSASINNQVVGITESRSYANTEYEKKKFEKAQQKYRTAMKETFLKKAVWDTFNIMSLTMITLSVLLISVLQLYSGKINSAELAGLVSAAALMTSPIMKFIQVYNMYSMGLASIERFYEFMDIPEERTFGNIPVEKFNGVIELKNVYFSYINDHGEKEEVLRNFSIKINAGEHVAFVGETGVGKSTILKIILGFYPIDKGEILIDGININKYNIEQLRKAIAYIQQFPIIFMDNVFNNIAYGKYKASKTEVITAAKEAYIHESIMSMPNGYDTFTGPNGAQLSGGQRQRVALARSFMKQSSIILLDEATSSLDNKTEKLIKNTIAKLSKKKTAIIVAHRLTTIQDVDRVIVLGKYGKIIEEGTHKELIKNKGIYSMLSAIK